MGALVRMLSSQGVRVTSEWWERNSATFATYTGFQRYVNRQAAVIAAGGKPAEAHTEGFSVKRK